MANNPNPARTAERAKRCMYLLTEVVALLDAESLQNADRPMSDDEVHRTVEVMIKRIIRVRKGALVKL